METPQPDPCEYIDYRDYLAEFYRLRKLEKSWFSYKWLGDKVEMDPSLLAKVISKARHISDEAVPRFQKACGLEGRYADYFVALVHFTKASTDASAKEWFERMLSLRQPNSRRVEGDAYPFYQRWYHTALRAALDYFPFDGSEPEKLGLHLFPHLTVQQVEESIELLSSLGLIGKDENGYYRPTEKGITTGSGWKSVAVHTFQSETLLLALQGLNDIPKSLRNYSTLTMNVSEEDFEEIKERLKEFRSQLTKFIHSRPQGDRVYQLNLQLLPLTECWRKL